MLRLDPGVYEALEKWAADEFCSVNGQIEWILDSMLKEHAVYYRQGHNPNAALCMDDPLTYQHLEPC